MTGFLRTKIGITCVLVFIVLMGFMTHRVTRRPAAVAPASPTNISKPAPNPPQTSPAPGTVAPQPKTSKKPKPASDHTPQTSSELQQSLSNLDQVSRLSKQSRADRDRSGQPITRRKTSTPAPTVAPGNTKDPSDTESSAAANRFSSLRLSGRHPRTPNPDEHKLPASNSTTHTLENTPPANAAAEKARPSPDSPKQPHTPDPQQLTRFAPFGRPIKCELVFTLDSTLEETPIVALVVEPVYNNGRLVLPAGTELHGNARPDRLRDRIFSARDWMMIFPREGAQPNGRQLKIVGYALDRDEPEGQGNTWGISDGSFGLKGEVIRTMNEAEIRRFAASFLSAATLTLQERQGGLRNRSVANTPSNAALAGTSTVLTDIAKQISQEIEQHGVFIRVPAGKQFYFYPQQAISPDRASLPAEAFSPEPSQASYP